jgi:hypothetical protein
MHCAVSCWILVEHGNREWASDRKERVIWLKHDIHSHGVPRWTPLGSPWFFLKNQGQEGKINLFQRYVPVEDGWILCQNSQMA